MPAKSIEIRARHVRQESLEDQLRIQRAAEWSAARRGDNAEASRSRARADAILDKMAKQERARGDKRLAMRRADKRDPLKRFPQSLQRAAEDLRWHYHGEVIAVSGSGFRVDYVDGGSTPGPEHKLDRRIRGRIAWQMARETSDDEEVWLQVVLIIVYRRSIRHAARSIWGQDTSRNQVKMRDAVWSALDAAAVYLGTGGD